MLKEGQIKFTKQAAKIAKKYFKIKKIDQLLIISKKNEKPSEYVEFYKYLLGKNQNSNSEYIIYTNNIKKSKKLFKNLLLENKKIRLLKFSRKNYWIYVTKSEKSMFKDIKSHENDESTNKIVKKIKEKFVKYSIDLMDLLSEIMEENENISAFNSNLNNFYLYL